MAARLSPSPSKTDYEALRVIWGDNSSGTRTSVESRQVKNTQSIRRPSYDELFESRLQHISSNAKLRDMTPSAAEWWLTMYRNVSDSRKQAPIGTGRSEIFGGTYDSGSGCYEPRSSAMNQRFPNLEAYQPISSRKTMSTVAESRRSSSASLWEASSGYSSDLPSPRLRPGDSASCEIEPFSPKRHSNDNVLPFFEALNRSSIGQQPEQPRQKQKIQQDQAEPESKTTREDVDRLYRLFCKLMVDSSEKQTTLDKPCPRENQTERLDHQIKALKGILGAEYNVTASQRRTSPSDSISSKPQNCRQQHDITGGFSSKVSLPSSPSSNSRDTDSTSFFQNDNALVSRPNPYEDALQAIEEEAKQRRTSAFRKDATFTWQGTLAPRFFVAPTYASKVFIGGLPYDASTEMLEQTFGQFGASVQLPPRGRGHAYLVFENELQVQVLLDACETRGPGQFFYWVPSRRGKDRKAQVIPWATENSDWLAEGCNLSSPSETTSSGSDSLSLVSDESSTSSTESLALSHCNHASPSSKGWRTPPKTLPDTNGPSKQNTVFVGALHGEITAEGLQRILSELFGPIIHVGIDTDKKSYPNGSARVTFASAKSFRQAVLAEYVHVVTPRFSKTIQLDAYIEDGSCSLCRISTPVFCRHPDCFRYYCATCFIEHRRNILDYHPPVMRNRNNAPSPANVCVPTMNGVSTYNIGTTGQTKSRGNWAF